MNGGKDNLVEIKDVCFNRTNKMIFDGISLNIPRGKVVGIMGPSGTGKTTLLRLIGNQLRPDSGSIFVDGQDISKLSCNNVFKLRRKMGVLFQSGALFTDMSVFENVAFPLRVHTQLSESLLKDIVLLKLQSVGLRGANNLYPRELSGGMQRRVALARAIILDPSIVMYDEPFVGQDPISSGILVKLIRVLNQSMGLTSIIISHDINETMSISDYLYVIAHGQVVGQGKPDELLASNDPLVKQFMNGYPDGPVPFHYPAKPQPEEFMGEKNHVRSC